MIHPDCHIVMTAVTNAKASNNCIDNVIKNTELNVGDKIQICMWIFML